MSDTEEFSLNSFSSERTDKYDVFDSLTNKYSVETDDYKKTKILHALVQSYLLHFKEEIEMNIKTDKFLELTAQIPLLCNKFLQSTTSLNSSSLLKMTSSKSQNLESASLCFDALTTCLKTFQWTKHCVIFVKISLNILSQGYTHCKESEIIYGDYLEQFSEQLGVFFKKIESLQMIVLQQIDELNIDCEPDINCIILEMGNLCQIVFSLDADIAFELWAKYARIIEKHPTSKMTSNISSLSTYLMSKNIEILEHIKYSLERNSEEDEELSAKFSFYLDALSNMNTLVPESCKENVTTHKNLLLKVLDCLLSCFSPFTLEKTCSEIIKQSLLKNSFILLSNFYTSEDNLKEVLLTQPDEKNNLSVFCLKLCALQFMKGSQLHLKIDFFRDIISDCSLGAVNGMKMLDIHVPRCTVSKISTNEFISLYQFAYEQISEFSKLLPDSAIQDLESTIFAFLESCSEVNYLLISDVWIYRLRCGNVEFMKDRCYSVLQYLSVTSIKNIKIENLIKRILKFIPDIYEERFFEEFSSLKFLLNSESIQHRYGVPNNTFTDNEICFYSEKQINNMIKKLCEASSNAQIQFVEKACICLELCTFFLSAANCSETLQFIKAAFELFKTNVYEIQITVLTFIKTLGRKSLSEHSQEFGEVVTLLASLFSEAIHSKNYVVKYEARNVFSVFAKCTPHIKIVQETIRRDPSLKPTIKSYMNAIPENGFLSERDKLAYLKKSMSVSIALKYEIPKECIKSIEIFFSKCNFQHLI